MPGERASAPSWMRKPQRRIGRRPRHIEMRQRFQHLAARGFQRIDAQIERRAAGQGHAFGHPRSSPNTDASELRIQPFGIVTRNISGRIRPDAAEVQRAALLVAVNGSDGAKRAIRRTWPQSASASMTTLQPQHAEQSRARRLLAHEIGRMKIAAAARRTRGPRWRSDRPTPRSDAPCPTPSAHWRRGFAARRSLQESRWLRTAARQASWSSFRVRRSSDREQNLECEIDPHDQKHKRTGGECREAHLEIVRGRIDPGMNVAGHHEHP
jgi:hypothetical protein